MAREKHKGRKPRGESTDALAWDGLACSSHEGSVTGLEQGAGLAGGRSEPRRLGCGHNELLSQIARIELIWLPLGMFHKCRLNFRQTGIIFGENAMKVTTLEGLQDSGSRLGQSVSILMNWRTGFEKRSR
jgi:hypothetical protein